jgi:DNA repair protein SbcD/Mre11
MKLLHTSDIQLDAPFNFLGPKGQSYRQQLRDTFAEILDFAVRDGYQVLLIAGDLFDSNSPSQRTVEFVVNKLARVAIPVCILPGNHDCYNSGSVYRKAEFPPNVTIFTETMTEKIFPDLDLTIQGRAILRKDSFDGPLMTIRPTTGTRWQVAMAHGNIVAGLVENPPRPIRPEEIAASGMNYVALGDWHAYSDRSSGNVKAAYSGSPEPMSSADDGAGYVASIEIKDLDIGVQPIRVGKVTAKKIRITVEGKGNTELMEEIRRLSDPYLILEVSLSGLQSVGELIDAQVLETELSSDFYHFQCQDETHPWLEKISENDFPSQLAIGRFVALMRGRIEAAASEADHQKAERALQVGVALLQGKEVL